MWPVLSRVRVCQVAFRLPTGHLQVTAIGPIDARQQPCRLVGTVVTVFNVRIADQVPGLRRSTVSRERTRSQWLSCAFPTLVRRYSSGRAGEDSRNSVSGTRRVTVDDAVSELIEPRRQPSRGLGHVRLLGDGVVEIGQQAASDLLA